MRTLGKIAAALGVVGTIGVTSVAPASALDVYIGHRHHHHLYNYGGYPGADPNGCAPGYSLQGGVCKPYRHGPWDIYGGRQSDYGY